MTDVFSKKKRSEVMSRIKGRGAQSTELAMRSALRQAGISGWRSNYKGLPGTPDFAFPKAKLAIFVHGCFWHGCRRCRRNLKPSSNARYWTEKIASNRLRDRRKVRQLRNLGWRVIQIWEHSLEKSSEECVWRLGEIFTRNHRVK